MEDPKEKAFALPGLSLPKGGGEIQGMGEKFAHNPVTGTASLSIPLPISPGRAGMQPGLVLQYDSGGGNGPFGLGWSIGQPAISRRTSRGLPTYQDEADVFQIGGAEDLVPALLQGAAPQIHEFERIEEGEAYMVRRYRPRTEGAFTRIERWTHLASGVQHWRTRSSANVCSIYGRTPAARVCDPEKPHHVFQWLLEEVSDKQGQRMVFAYKTENSEGIPTDRTEEIGRLAHGFAQRYLKSVRYTEGQGSTASGWHFHLVFDYGEHDLADPRVDPSPGLTWSLRPDPHSNCRGGFELRTYRLCRRVLMFHDFPELGNRPILVKALELEYDLQPTASLLRAACLRGYGPEGDRATPAMEMDYVPLAFDTTVRRLPEDQQPFYPGKIDGQRHQWTDLYGEGMPGLLHTEGGSIRYRANLGEGRLAPSRLIGTLPAALVRKQKGVFMDFDQDGQLDLLIADGPAPGHYAFRDEQWRPFAPLRNFPATALARPDLRWLDLDGDGRPDLLLTEERAFSFFLKGAQGFAQRRQAFLPLDEQQPVCIHQEAGQGYFFADMTGDGLADLVRVRNGAICYWPHLGYGRFGEKVQMRDAPAFERADQFSPAHLRLVDLDGSGPADLVYFGGDRVQLYTNQSGNAWALAADFPAPCPADALNDAELVDLLGNGTVCLVWTSDAPNHAGGLAYIDLLAGGKPRLLSAVRNNLGAETRYTYASSTRFYREDEAAGRPWITRLAFPVHVVTQITSIDHISGAQFGKRFAYHHGHYDVQEREFRGFGMVEQWDTESYDWFEQAGNEISRDYYVPPVRTCTWFHTGSWAKHEIFSRQYAAEYFQGDPLAPDLADSEIVGYAYFSLAEKQEAVRALRGMTLRQEVYAEDGSPQAHLPYLVTESRARILRVQPKAGQAHAIFRVEQLESLSLNYDRNPADPRITHQFSLEFDGYGFATRTASVAYPRRVGQPDTVPEQLVLHVGVSDQAVLHYDEAEDDYQLGIPTQSRSFQLGGVRPAGSIFTHAELRNQAYQAISNPIPFEETLNGQYMQARRLSEARTIYWHSNLQGALEFGMVDALPPLVHHHETVAFGMDHFKQVFAGKVSPKRLKRGGYRQYENYAWVWSPVITWEKIQGTFVPVQTRDSFRNVASVAYDAYGLFATSATDALGSQSTATADYRTLSFWRLVDPNGSVAEVKTDALGMVIASTVHGTYQGQSQGDLPIAQYQVQAASGIDEVVAQPHKFLQWASSFFYYDIWAFADRGEAPCAIGLTRERHVRDIGPQAQTPVQMQVAYSDGFGRSLQTKLRVEEGPAFLRNPDGSLQLQGGQPVLGNAAVRWLGSGRALYNNKGKAVKQWEPFYSTTHHYEPETELTRYGISPFLHYDALGRVIRTDSPDGSFTSVRFDPWQATHFDSTDNVLLSDWYVQRGSPSPTQPEPAPGNDAARAAWRSAQLANTPGITRLDSLGRSVRGETILENGRRLVASSTFEATGQPLTLTDPRQHSLNAGRVEPLVNFRYSYAMGGLPLTAWSADAGEGWTLCDANGAAWRSGHKGLYTIHFRDALRRPTHVVHRFGGRAWTAEVLHYGESEPNAAARNLIGRVVRHYHPGGLDENLEVNFKGEILHTSVRLVRGHLLEPDWSLLLLDPPAAEELLETRAYLPSMRTDALGRLLEKVEADGSRVLPSYHSSGLLRAMTVVPQSPTAALPNSQGQSIPIVRKIEYNEKGQRKRIEYGSGTANDPVSTVYTYDPLTYRLTHMHTRGPNGKVLQDLHYTYDIAGNITCLRDDAFPAVFNSNQVVEARAEYYYDALNRLVKATGREHKAFYHTNGFSQQWAETWLAELNPQGSLNDPNFSAPYHQTFTYDDAGNLTHLRHFGNRSYTREMAISPHSNRAVLKDHLGSRAVDELFDRSGNLKEMEHLHALRWNGRSQLVSAVVTPREAPAISDAEYYVYNGNGQRVRKLSEQYEHSGNRVRIVEKVYLGGVEILRVSYRYASGAVDLVEERYTLHGMDDLRRVALIHSWRTDTTGTNMAGQTRVHYQVSNHLGSAAMELSAAGQVVTYEEYFPYGETAFQIGRSAAEIKWKDYRYTGMERDVFTGLSYHSARYYAPWIGRWISPDPAGIVDGFNLYQYVSGNPITLIDPSGNAWVDCRGDGKKHSDEECTRLEQIDKESTYAVGEFNEETETWSFKKEVNPEEAKKRLGAVGMDPKLETYAEHLYPDQGGVVYHGSLLTTYEGFTTACGDGFRDLCEYKVSPDGGKPQLMTILKDVRCPGCAKSCISPIDFLPGPGTIIKGAKALVQLGGGAVRMVGAKTGIEIIGNAGVKPVAGSLDGLLVKEIEYTLTSSTSAGARSSGVRVIGKAQELPMKRLKVGGLRGANTLDSPTVLHIQATSHGGGMGITNLFLGEGTANLAHAFWERIALGMARAGKEVTVKAKAFLDKDHLGVFFQYEISVGTQKYLTGWIDPRKIVTGLDIPDQAFFDKVAREILSQ